LTLVVYSIPWGRVGEEVTTGWGFTIPFLFTYLIGILLGLIMLLIKFRPVIMTIIAGILMIIEVIGAIIGIGLAELIGALTGEEVSGEAGLGFAFLMSLIYTVMGSYAGGKMVKVKMPSPEYDISSTKPRILSCPKCGSANTTGYMGEYECMSCGHKFRIEQQVPSPKPPPPSTAVSYPSRPSRGIRITLVIVLLVMGFLLGGIVRYSSREIVTTVLTLTYPTAVTSTITFSKTLPLTTVTLLTTRATTLSFTKLVTITMTPKPKIYAEITSAEAVIKMENHTFLVRFNVTSEATIRLIGPDGVEKDHSTISPPETGIYLKMTERLYGYETPPPRKYHVIIMANGVKIVEKEFEFTGYNTKVIKVDFVGKEWNEYFGGRIEGIIIHLREKKHGEVST
jgi:DNA-directed RNA polymerase subunit RPC12/RpoP